ncbi:MAG: LysM peptidoglycan-binding domain-containing protein [Gemmataceae bacterium]|nr:LysM peptidoglycan-binding domain-containing protein [Gemmataceae bacterium]
MTDPLQALQALLQGGGAGDTRFPPTSRYHGVGTATLTTADGRTVVYLRRRLVPSPERFDTLREYVVVEGDRLDLIAARFVGDPEQFWRVCDANGAVRPGELEEVGRRLRLTLPEGVPGDRGADA